MYQPAAFAVTDPTEIVALIDAIAAGHVVTSGPAGFTSSFLPLVYDGERGVLRGHLARANPHHREMGQNGAPALVIFSGPDTYVSPSWYPSKAKTGKAVPTWNYEVVHVHGVARAIDDPTAAEGSVRELTARHEAGRSDPWAIEDAPASYIEAMLRAIVAVEVTVERVEAKRKLSQNRPDEDVAGVVAGLSAGDERDVRVAQEMSR